MAIKVICDRCGREIQNENRGSPSDGLPGKVEIEEEDRCIYYNVGTDDEDEEIVIEEDIHYCRHCLLWILEGVLEKERAGLGKDKDKSKGDGGGEGELVEA